MCVLVEWGRCSRRDGWCPRFDVSVSEAQTAELIMGQQVRVAGGGASILEATG